MTYVATLVVDPARAALEPVLLARAAEAVPVTRTEWLDPEVAADLVLDQDRLEGNACPRLLRDRLSAALAGHPVDVAVQPAAGRRKRLLISDVDSTVIGQECIDELADVAGLKAEVAAITERAMRGELAFEPALRERVALLAGIPTEVVGTLLEERITLNPGAVTLFRTMAAMGARTVLVSGGFDVFTGPIAARVGAGAQYANRLATEGGRLTGRLAGPIVGPDAKRERLATLMAELALSKADTVALGDGANDVAMVEAAGLGVAFRAKPVLKAVADAALDHTGLDSVLFFQGYRRAEFVAPA